MDTFWVYTSVRDEEHLMPFFLRHYLDYADRVIVQDCGSTDRTKAIVKASGATLIETEPWGMDEVRRRNESMRFVQDSRGKTQWCACVDSDEFLVGDFDRAFDEADKIGCKVMQTIGITMLADGFPIDDGRQIYEICTTGARAGAEKPCIVRTDAEFLWSAGKHFIDSPGTKVAFSRIWLLHYRYMGKAYTASRNAKNYANSTEKATAWSCAPDYVGDQSPDGVQASLNRKDFSDFRGMIADSLNWPSPMHGWTDRQQPFFVT